MRHSVSKPKSVKKFKARVGKVDAINLRRNLRGGIRL